MVTITSSGNSVQFTFQNCPTYLNNGTIETPKDSLALVVDDSDMVTFKKAASNDIFVSVSLDELGMTKNEIISFYQSDMTGGNGVTPEEVEEMIDEATSGKADTSTVETLSGEVQTLSGEVANKADTTALTAHTSDATIHVTTQDKTNWNGKLDASALAPYYTSAQTQSAITQATSGKADTSTVETLSGEVQTVSGQVANKADTTALTAHINDTTVHVTASDKTAWNGKLDASALTPYWTSAQTDSAITQAISGKADVSAVTALSDEIDAKEEVISTALNELYDGIDEVSGNVGTLSGQVTANTSNILTVSGNVGTLATTVSGIQTQLGGIKLVALTQAQYDALVTKDANTLYIIND